MEINNRFKDAPWYANSENLKIVIAGLGGIGSNALYYLAKTIPANYILFDADFVEQHNIGTQFFSKEDIGAYKVNALQKTIHNMSTARIRNNTLPFGENSYMTPIFICGFDNMNARKNAFNNWKSKENRELFIDGRMRATYYEVFTVQPGMEKAYEATLFEDGDVDEGPCTFKQSAYIGGLIGARITNILVNYLTNKNANFEICDVPFHMEEITEILKTNIDE